LTSCNSLRISAGKKEKKKTSGIIRSNTAISQRRKLESKVEAFVQRLAPPVYWVVVLGPKSRVLTPHSVLVPLHMPSTDISVPTEGAKRTKDDIILPAKLTE